MARVKKESPVRLAIIQAATELFFERGFSKTTAAAVCARAKIGTGNLTSYFPTKEHILEVLVKMMIEFQPKCDSRFQPSLRNHAYKYVSVCR